MNLERVLAVAVAAARDAVTVHRENLGVIGSADWTEKGNHDFVTRVDHEAESRIIERIVDAFPDHGILAEEQATSKSGIAAEYTAIPESGLAEARRKPGWIWIIDPLDGTTNYLHRHPMYSASVAALLDGEPVAGAIVDGVTGQAWTATRGGGAFLDDRPIHVSETGDLSRSLIGTGFPFKALDQLPAYLEQFRRVMTATAGIRRAGSAAMDLCHVAAGYFDGFWELSLAPWDLAAGVLIVREAGGTVSRVDGDADVIGAGSVLAGNSRVHEALAVLLSGVGSDQGME